MKERKREREKQRKKEREKERERETETETEREGERERKRELKYRRIVMLLTLGTQALRWSAQFPFLSFFLGWGIINIILTLVIFQTPIHVGPDPFRKGSIINVTTYVATVNY